MNMIVTNLRVPEDKYRRHKVMAAEEGMSFNEYVIQTLEEKAREKQFGKPAKKVKKLDFYEAMEEFLKDDHPNEPMGLSKEDEIIYG